MSYDVEKYVALDKKHVWHHLTNHKNFEPAIYVKGEGNRVTDINALTDKYLLQLNTYKKALERCFGVSCKSASIYYLDTNTIVEI